MNFSLTTLQNQFAKALHYQATGEECNIASDNFTADERMQIYRNNFVMSLTEVLQATYPMVVALVGEECFNGLARQHVLTHPLESGDVTHYGEHFSDTITLFPVVLEAAPYLPEVARFEWSLDLSQQLHGSVHLTQTILPISKLADVPAEQHDHIQLHLTPSVMTFASHYGVFSLQRAIHAQQLDGLEINQAEAGVIACQIDGTPWSQPLDEEAYQLLSHLQAGQHLSEIPASLLPHLNQIMGLGLIAGFSLTQ